MGWMLLEDYDLSPLPPVDDVGENDEFMLFLATLSQDDSAFHNASCPTSPHAPLGPALDIGCSSDTKQVLTSSAGGAESQVWQQQTGFSYRLTSFLAYSAAERLRGLEIEAETP